MHSHSHGFPPLLLLASPLPPPPELTKGRISLLLLFGELCLCGHWGIVGSCHLGGEGLKLLVWFMLSSPQACLDVPYSPEYWNILFKEVIKDLFFLVEHWDLQWNNHMCIYIHACISTLHTASSIQMYTILSPNAKKLVKDKISGLVMECVIQH